MEIDKATETKNHIVNTALNLFLEKGFHGATMSDLVKNANISKGAFYYHFQSKGLLYEAVVEKFLYPLFPKDTLKTLQNLKSHQEIQKFLMQSYITSLKELHFLIPNGNANFYSLFFEAFQVIPEFQNIVREFYTDLKDLIKLKLEEEGETSSVLSEKRAINLIAKFEGIIFWTAIFPNADGVSLI